MRARSVNIITSEMEKIQDYENSLYEGLIKSVPKNSIRSLVEKKYKSNFDTEGNNFFITYLFNNNIEIALEELEDLITLTNNLGWFPSNIGYGEQFLEFVRWDKEKRNFKSLIEKNYLSIKFSFEPKYDEIDTNIEMADATHNRILYHLTPTLFVNKILKNGLIPRSRSKKSYHPDRIYLATNVEDCEKLIPVFKAQTKINNWTVLEINTLPINYYLELYKDQNFKDRGVFTLNTITPLCISVHSEYSFGDGDDIKQIDRNQHKEKRGVKKVKGNKSFNYEY
jgi:hypothetical protein